LPINYIIIKKYILQVQPSNSQYANPGSAFGETAMGEKYVKAVNQATGK